jgi:hypothetical protein
MHSIEIQLKQNDINDSDTIKIIYQNIFYSYLSKEPIKIGIAVFAIIGVFFLVFWLSRKSMRDTRNTTDTLNKNLPIIKRIQSSECTDQIEDDFFPSHFSETKEIYSKAWLIEKKGPEIGKKFFIFRDQVTIGSGNDNHIMINDESISEIHAKIKNIKGEFSIYDLVSDTGIYLNKKKLLRPKVLNDWDEIQVGSVVLIFRGTHSDTPQ